MKGARCNVKRNVRQLLQSGRDATGSAQPAPQTTWNRRHATATRNRVQKCKQNRRHETCSMQHRQDARCNADQMQHAALQHATRKTRHAALKQVTSTQCEYRCEYPRVPQSTRDSGGAFGRRAQRSSAVQQGLFNARVSGCAPNKACTCNCTRKAAFAITWHAWRMHGARMAAVGSGVG